MAKNAAGESRDSRKLSGAPGRRGDRSPDAENRFIIRVDSWLTSCARHRTRGHCALSAMLTVSHLSKSFAGRGALRQVSLQVNRGDLIRYQS